MGKGKKEKNRTTSLNGTGNSAKTRISAPVKGENFYRDAKKMKQVRMLKGGKPVRNSQGKIIKAADYQSRLASGTVGRVQADRRWFCMFLSWWMPIDRDSHLT